MAGAIFSGECTERDEDGLDDDDIRRAKLVLVDDFEIDDIRVGTCDHDKRELREEGNEFLLFWLCAMAT